MCSGGSHLVLEDYYGRVVSHRHKLKLAFHKHKLCILTNAQVSQSPKLRTKHVLPVRHMDAM